MHSELLLEKKFPTGQSLNHGALFFYLSVLIVPLLKDQVRHITFKSLFEQKSIWIGSQQTRVLHHLYYRCSSRDLIEKRQKQSNYLLDCSLSSCLIWESLVGGLWLIGWFLAFIFLSFECIDFGLGLDLLWSCPGIRVTPVYWFLPLVTFTTLM